MAGGLSRAAVAVGVALAWPFSAASQSVVRVADEVQCECELSVRLIATLDDPDGLAGLAEPNVIERSPSGDYLVVPAYDFSVVLVFDSDGVSQGRLGGSGQGPGEFRSVTAIRSGPGDSTTIMDAGNGRVVVIDRDMTPARTAQTRFARGFHMGVLANGTSMIMTGFGSPAAEPRDRLHLLSPSGQLVRSFMPGPGGDPELTVADLRRRFGVSGDGLVAVTHWRRYVVEIWDTSGVHLRTLVREPPWFPPVQDPDVRGRQQAPFVHMEVPPRVDSLGRVWTMTYVRDSGWQNAPREVVDAWRRRNVSRGQLDRYYDSVVEIVDPDDGSLLGSLRVDSRMVFISNDGVAASYHEDAAGNPSIDIWAFTLVSR